MRFRLKITILLFFFSFSEQNSQGMVAFFDSECPSGWEKLDDATGRNLIGSGSFSTGKKGNNTFFTRGQKGGFYSPFLVLNSCKNVDGHASFSEESSEPSVEISDSLHLIWKEIEEIRMTQGGEGFKTLSENDTEKVAHLHTYFHDGITTHKQDLQAIRKELSQMKAIAFALFLGCLSFFLMNIAIFVWIMKETKKSADSRKQEKEKIERKLD